MSVIEFKGDNDFKISLIFSDISNAVEKRFLRCYVSVKILPFEGEFNGEFDFEDIIRLEKNLTKLNSLAIKEMSFESTCGIIIMQFQLTSTGKILLNGVLTDVDGSGVALHFNSVSDLTYIEQTLKQVKRSIKSHKGLS